MEQGKKIYFASDVHLGAPTINNQREHERRFVGWLDSIKDTASEIYLLGDIFDFWFEYKKAVPKGFSRFLGKLSELTDAGITVHFFTGNHDIWIFDYLPSETGVVVHKEPQIREIDGFRFFIAHGDGLTRFENGYRILKSVFNNKVAQWFFRWLHPDIGIWFATAWSKKSREKNTNARYEEKKAEGDKWLISWAKEILEKEHFDFFIFGHRHVAMDIDLTSNSRFVYLGDWISLFSYGEWDGSRFELKKFSNK